jgi:hypothetical protein
MRRLDSARRIATTPRHAKRSRSSVRVIKNYLPKAIVKRVTDERQFFKNCGLFAQT